MALTSRCSLISTRINPQHTWWDFQYSSLFQIAEIELSLCKSSSCFHHSQFNAYHRQSAYIDTRPFGHSWVQVTVPRSKQYFRHCVWPQQNWQQVKALQILPFPVRLQCHLFPLSSCCAHACMRGDCYHRVNIGQCCCVHSNQRNTEKAVVYSDQSTGGGYKFETILKSLICCCQSDSVISLQLWGFSRSCLDTYCPAF